MLRTTPAIARPIGSNIKVVDVFIIHILINALTNIKPPIRYFASVPIKRSILRAILLCRLTFSIARANMKPPRNRNTLGCAYGAATLVKALFAGLLASLKS